MRIEQVPSGAREVVGRIPEVEGTGMGGSLALEIAIGGPEGVLGGGDDVATHVLRLVAPAAIQRLDSGSGGGSVETRSIVVGETGESQGVLQLADIGSTDAGTEGPVGGDAPGQHEDRAAADLCHQVARTEPITHVPRKSGDDGSGSAVT
ncbi:MAG: hypothetical protein ACTHNS_16175 [Marmoricola sp.]